jgi:TRAP-type C4-dicarboxylate transport system permease small subunit
VKMMYTNGRTSPNLRIPLWFVYAPIFIGSAVMFLSLICDLIIRVHGRTRGHDVAARPDEAEGAVLWN